MNPKLFNTCILITTNEIAKSAIYYYRKHGFIITDACNPKLFCYFGPGPTGFIYNASYPNTRTVLVEKKEKKPNLINKSIFKKKQKV